MLDLLYGLPNISFFDSYWAAVHFSSGLLTGMGVLSYYHYHNKELPLRRYASLGIGLLVIWEYFELSLRFINRYGDHSKVVLRSIIPGHFFDSESVTNIVSDLILGSIGLYLIYQYRNKRSTRINQKL